MIALNPDTPLAPVEKRTLIIAMTERSGSTNLCSVLAKLGPFGEPEEYFNPQGLMETLPEKLGAKDASDYLAKLAERSEIFCFKVSALNWRPFEKRARTVFPNARYVYLDRMDLEAQAISLYRARKTWIWHKPENSKGTMAAPEFDAAELEECRQHLMIGKTKWANFFFQNDIKPLHIKYEHLLADMPKAVQMISGEAGRLVFKDTVPGGDFRILRDETSEAWKERLQQLRVGEVPEN